mgnify:CR=1 FL=1
MKQLFRIFALGVFIAAASSPNHANLTHAQSNANPAGQVRFFKVADSSFDTFTNNPNAATRKWMRKHYWRMLTFTPYFDSRLVWYPNAWVYKDLYAIYVDQDLASEHPEWILKDAEGNNLYIPWGCSDGTCPQYAADVGNPDFRAHWLAEASATLAQGYRGLWVDDVNLEWRVSDGDANFVHPIDPRTNAPMTRENWQEYFVAFTEAIYAAFPNNEIAHNALWFADDVNNPYVQRQIDSADWINLERGINDNGLTGGTGAYGIETFFAYIDAVHARGRAVIFEAYANTKRGREFGLAGWLLSNNGWDSIGNHPKWSTPDDWWNGYDLNLGAARGDRYIWRNVYRRNFERGIVLLNPPQATTRVLTFKNKYRTLNGESVSQVRLKAKQGIVLLNP